MKAKGITSGSYVYLGFKKYVYEHNYPAYERENVNWKYAYKKQVTDNN